MTNTNPLDPFVERTYQDTYDLLVALRDYVADDLSSEAMELETADQLRLTEELSRLTRRLTDVMAWLMIQKAVAGGEMTTEEGRDAPAAQLESLDDSDYDDDSEALSRLPLSARGLIGRARQITTIVRQLKGGDSA
jgi:regulator of CtrA degradation